MQKWITKKDGNENKHIRIETERKAREVQIQDIGPTPAQLEKQAWGILGDLSKITTVDQLLLQMRKYSGTLGDYSGFNSMLIAMQDPGADQQILQPAEDRVHPRPPLPCLPGRGGL